MARKSAAALATVSNIPGQRPEPPAFLNARQSEEWRAIVGRMPSDWFTRENFSLLSALVAHVDRLERVNAVLASVIPDQDNVRDYKQWTMIAEREGRAISALATRMRLTQQSRYRGENAATMVKDIGAGAKPWEIKKVG